MRKRTYGFIAMGVAAAGYVAYRKREFFQGWRTRRSLEGVAHKVAERSHERFDRGATLAEHLTVKEKA